MSTMPIARHALLLHYNRRHHPAMIGWLRERSYRVTSVSVNLGEVADADVWRDEAMRAGAHDAIHVDRRREFCEQLVAPAIKANAAYEREYLLSAALARPMLAMTLVELAAELGADTICHGFRGNDQIRVDMGVAALGGPSSLAVLRAWHLTEDQIMAAAARIGVDAVAGTGNPFSTSENLWGRSIECGDLGEPSRPAPPDLPRWVAVVAETPDVPTRIGIEFIAGVPVALDGERLELAALIDQLNQRGAAHGVGVVDTMENGLVGLKSRAIYEHPGARILLTAHEDLERLVLNRHEGRAKPHVEHAWANLVYDGLWFDPQRRHYDAYLDSVSRRVSGTATVELFKGAARVIARESTEALWSADQAIYNFGDHFAAGDAEAFGRVFGLHTNAARSRDRGN